MVQEIEIEYKTLLTKNEYNILLNALPFSSEAIMQMNHYFETDDFSLKKHHSALRIRNKGQRYTLTLKEPHEEGILETHDELTEAEFEQWIDGKAILKPNIQKQLQAMGIETKKLHYFGALQTERRTFTQEQIIYVLDKSIYNNKVDYELEIEAPSKESGQQAFDQLKEQYPISNQQSITKIERFFLSLTL